MRFSTAFQEELDALFRWRRDVRRFRADPIPEPLLTAVLGAAGSAPSVGLSEPWRFVQVRSAEARAAVIESHRRCYAAEATARAADDAAAYARLKLAGLAEAPAHLAAFVDETDDKGRGLGRGSMPEAKRYSVVCAVMQIWLAARARGLGVGWVSILDPEAVRDALSAPETWTLVAYLCLGWPEEEHLDTDLERAGWEPRDRLAGRIFTA